LFWCGVKSVRIGFFHVSHSGIYRVNALVFNSKANLERRGFRPKFSMRQSDREIIILAAVASLLAVVAEVAIAF
jgi:hypothetical protein